MSSLSFNIIKGTGPFTATLETDGYIFPDIVCPNRGVYSISGIPAGEYTLVVNDGKGCSVTLVGLFASPTDSRCDCFNVEVSHDCPVTYVTVRIVEVTTTTTTLNGTVPCAGVTFYPVQIRRKGSQAVIATIPNANNNPKTIPINNITAGDYISITGSTGTGKDKVECTKIILLDQLCAELEYDYNVFCTDINPNCTLILPPILVGDNYITLAGISGSVKNSWPLDYHVCEDNSFKFRGYSVGVEDKPFTVIINFSKPVNNIKLFITGAGLVDPWAPMKPSPVEENFILITNTGVPTLETIISCFTTIDGNIIYSGMGFYSSLANPVFDGGGGGVFIIKNSVPYTSITISGNGGHNGSDIGFCIDSV